MELERQAYWEQNSTKDLNILQWNSSLPQFLLTQLLVFYLDYIQDYHLAGIKLEEININQEIFSLQKVCIIQVLF